MLRYYYYWHLENFSGPVGLHPDLDFPGFPRKFHGVMSFFFFLLQLNVS